MCYPLKPAALPLQLKAEGYLRLLEVISRPSSSLQTQPPKDTRKLLPLLAKQPSTDEVLSPSTGHRAVMERNQDWIIQKKKNPYLLQKEI